MRRALVRGLLALVGAIALGTVWWVLVPSHPRAWESVETPPVAPPPLAESLRRIDTWLADNHLPAARALRPGLSPDEIARRLRFVPGYVPGELERLYEWHDGQDTSFTQLTPLFRFMPLEEALRERRQLLLVRLALLPQGTFFGWDRRWLPVLAFEGNYWVSVVGVRPSVTAVCFESFLEEPEPVRVQGSLAALMAEMAACFESGAYFVNDEGELEEDRAAAHEIRRRAEPSLGPLVAGPDSLEPVVDALPDGSRVETRTAPNGVRFTRRFDASGRLLEAVQSDSRMGIASRVTNGYDDAGRIVGRRSEYRGAAATVSWTYGVDGKIVIIHKAGGRSMRIDAERKRDQRLKVIAVESWR